MTLRTMLRRIDRTPENVQARIRLATCRPRGRELFPSTSVGGIHAIRTGKDEAIATALRFWVDTGFIVSDQDKNVLVGSDGKRYVVTTAKQPDGTLVALIPEEMKDDPRSRICAKEE